MKQTSSRLQFPKNCTTALCKSIAVLWLTVPLSTNAINIEIDYTYDTNGWFDIAGRKEALDAAVTFYEEILSDTLLRVDPANFPGSTWTVFLVNPQTGGSEPLLDFVAPSDTIIIFAGARELGGNVRGQGGSSGYSASGSGSWLSRLRARGNPGADHSSANSNLATDFAPSVGSITFDVTTTFNFSTTQNLSGTDFIPVALHELGHVLGIGTAPSWHNLISGGFFTGPASIRAAGSPPAVQSSGGHYDQSVSDKPAFGSFGTPHGLSSPVMMRPSLVSNSGHLTVTSDLDLAGLVDIGWEVTPPLAPSFPSLGPSSTEINWPSSSFRDYVIERSTDLDFSSGTQIPTDGNGTVLSWPDPAPPAAKAFYRLRDLPDAPPVAMSAPLARRAAVANNGDEFMTDFVAPRWVEGCGCSEH